MQKSSVKTKLRVGKIAYTNCLPFYHGLDEAAGYDVEFFEAYPAKINEAIHTGKIDIAPVSSLEYLNHQNDYLLLPGVSISAFNISGSVLLFSKHKIEDLNGKKIAVTRESLSSVTLLKILFTLKHKFENEFEVVDSDPDRMLQDYPAALVIGDSALCYQPKDFVRKYDLAEMWWDWTGKPFCFSVWVVRKAFARESMEEVLDFSSHLQLRAKQNLQDLEKLIKDGLGMDFLNEKFSKFFGYLFNLQYHWTNDIQAGLEYFYQLAGEMEISPKMKPLEFISYKD